MSTYSRNRGVSVGSRNSRQANSDRRDRACAGSAAAAAGNYGALTGSSITPMPENMFQACAATASFLLYAQRNVILSLHHDTLAIDRRFERHCEDVRWIEIDNHSDRGAGRLVVSYDVNQTAIVWDVMNGQELARFASYEEIRVAAWMRNGEIAFGNNQGNIILFDHETKEHLSRRTIYDPITALAPSADCRTYAIGYANGSILIAGLHPTFTIIHTLTTQRHPSPINALSWHGSSSKSKSDMLASQTLDGDLRVWSIPKSLNGDPPSISRTFQRGGMERTVGPCWFAWSKMGRLVQFIDGQTLAWDVRTKKITYESVPTIEGVVGIASYGPQAVLFTIGRNHTVQQYDLNPTGTPMLVRNVQHVPATSLPPSPPGSDIDHVRLHMPGIVSAAGLDQRQSQRHNSSGNNNINNNNNLPLRMDTARNDAQDNFRLMSPVQRQPYQAPSEPSETEQSEEERDRLPHMSPTSTRSSNRMHKLTYPSRRERQSSSRLRPQSPGMQSTASGSTIMTSSSISSARDRRPGRSSRLKQEVLPSPQRAQADIDLFPFIRAHIMDVPFRPPIYPDGPRTADLLRSEMLKCVLGWDGEVEDLIRDELDRHEPGSQSAILLSKWLGDLGTDVTASMAKSQSMTSSDWMMLALSAVGGGAQKKVGDAFVQRLLEAGDVHPAVAILLGLGEFQEAIEIYVSRKLYLEAVILCCLLTPHDWSRQSHLVRKWGEAAISREGAELAVRCFACTSIAPSEQWTSPASTDMVYEAQMQYMGPTVSGSTASNSPSTQAPFQAGRRLPPKMAGLKLITDFTGPKPLGKFPPSAMDEQTPIHLLGATPLDGPSRIGRLKSREPMSSTTATPSGLTTRRMPSRGRWIDQLDTPVARRDQSAIPISAIRTQQDSSQYPASSNYRNAERDPLPSPAPGVFTRGHSRSLNMSRDRKPELLSLSQSDIVMIDASEPSASSMISVTQNPSTMPARSGKSRRSSVGITDGSINAQTRSLNDHFINHEDDDERMPSQIRRPDSRSHQSRTASRNRNTSRAGDRRYTRGTQRSPISPVSMSPEDSGLQGHLRMMAKHDGDEEYHDRQGSPDGSLRSRRTMETSASRPRGRYPSSSVNHGSSGRSSSKMARHEEPLEPIARTVSRNGRRDHSRPVTPEREAGRRGRSAVATNTQSRRSPHSPVSMVIGDVEAPAARKPRDQSVGAKVRARATSQNRQGHSPDRSQLRAHCPPLDRYDSPEEGQRRIRSHSAKPVELSGHSPGGRAARQTSRPPGSRLQTDAASDKRQIARAELEAARKNLLGKPSVAPITHPNDLIPRSASSLDFSSPWATEPARHAPRRMTIEDRSHQGHDLQRSQTVDPEAQRRMPGGSTTAQAMRAPRQEPEAMPTSRLPAGVTQVSNEEDQLATLSSAAFTLPSSTFQPPARSASAPPEKYNPGQARQQGRQPMHARMGSVHEDIIPPPPPPAPADAVIHHPSVYLSDDIMSIDDHGDLADGILPQLRHLADASHHSAGQSSLDMPLRIMSNHSSESEDVIEIAIDGIAGSTAATPVPSHMHHQSSSEMAVQHGLPQDIHTAYQHQHAPPLTNAVYQAASPYESVQTHMHAHSRSLDTAPPAALLQLPSTTYQARSGSNMTSTAGGGGGGGNPSLARGPRDPKQIRAAMTSEQVQYGMSAGPAMLPATTYLLERPHTAAPTGTGSSAKLLPLRRMESYRDPGPVRANMPPSSMQPGSGYLEGRPF